MTSRVPHTEDYHTLLKHEYAQYEESESFKDVSLTEDDFADLGISDEIIQTLLEEEFLYQLDTDLYRTLHMDVAFRASDIRVQHEGSQYILENDLKLKERPILDLDYVEFVHDDEKFQYLFSLIEHELGSQDLAESFFEALRKYGIVGLSKYQYDSIIETFEEDNDAVISAPTGFGKTLVFQIPSLVAALRDQEKDGVKSVFFYPRNALGSDQMDRLVQILQYLNEEFPGRDLTVGVDIGATSGYNMDEGDELLGAECTHHGSKLIYKNGQAYCPSGDHYLDFIQPARPQIYDNPPDLLISNIWAWQHRLIKSNLWSNGYLGDHINYIVFDEVHEYRGVVAGVVKYFIRTIQRLVAPNSRLLLSSATIPGLENFIESITGQMMSNILDLVYDSEEHGEDRQKLELYLLAGVNPHTSWETYAHELGIYLSTANRLKSNKNLQSLIFVDSIKNIQRLYRQTLQAIDLGDPRDHLSSQLESTDPYTYWIYNGEYKLSDSELYSQKVDDLRDEIKNNVQFHHSNRPDRHEIEDDLTEGNIDLTYATSTLELGVDYERASVVVNAGIPFSLESIPQRVGRAGRNEESSLNTSLSIITVRNNPLEYMYLQRGIEGLTDVDRMPEIPVSDDNHFVVLYSALLYIAARLVSDRGPLDDDVDSASMVMSYLDEHETEVLGALGTNEDISRTKEDVEEVLEILQAEDIDEVYEDILQTIKTSGILARTEDILQRVEDLSLNLRANVDEVPARDRENVEVLIDELDSVISKNSDVEDLGDAEELLFDLDTAISEIKERIRSVNHPLYEYRSNLNEISSDRIGECLDDLSDIDRISREIQQHEGDESLYIRASEVYNEIREAYTLIQVLESLVGFRYMGNEFIDHKVDVETEQNTAPEQEESLSNVVARMSPFEMQDLPIESGDARDITKHVGGRYSWFIEPENYYLLSEGEDQFWDIKNSLDEAGVALGSSTEYPSMRVPRTIEFVDFLSRDAFTLKINCQTDNGTKPLYIRYGSDEIVNSEIKGRYSIKQNIKELGDQSNPNYSTVKEATERKLESIGDRLIQNNPWGANFDYISACQIGRAISTDPTCQQCPAEIQEDCQLCDGKEHWSTYRKMFPKVHVNKEVRNYPKTDRVLSLDLDTVTYDDLTDDIEFVYNKVNVNIPTSYKYYQREFEVKPIGYRARTSLVNLPLNETFIDIIIDNLLAQRPNLTRLLKYKYYMYTKYRGLGHTSEVAPEVFNYDPDAINPDSQEFREFARESLTHTLAHMLYLYIVKEVGVDAQKLSCHPQDGEIVIFEDSKRNGMGVVETIRNRLDNKGAFGVFDEFGNDILDFLSDHDDRIEAQMKQKDDNTIKKLENKDDQIASLSSEMEDLNQKIEQQVDLQFVDFSTYRYLLLDRLEEDDEETAEYVLPLVQARGVPHLCYDGCNECVILEKYCNEPFGQSYLLSKKLLQAFLNYYQGGSASAVKRGLGHELRDLFSNANELRVKTPFIDQFGIDLLQDLIDGGTDVTLVTRREDNSRWISQLEKMNLKLKFAEEYGASHAKAYYMKNDESSLLAKGSVNLQQKGFLENEENMSLVWDKDEILSIVEDIEGI